jgi:hypothetical protein
MLTSSFECPICLETINYENPHVKTRCNHLFCFDCFTNHQYSGNNFSQSCPLCRSPILLSNSLVSSQVRPIETDVSRIPNFASFRSGNIFNIFDLATDQMSDDDDDYDRWENYNSRTIWITPSNQWNSNLFHNQIESNSSPTETTTTTTPMINTTTTTPIINTATTTTTTTTATTTPMINTTTTASPQSIIQQNTSQWINNEFHRIFNNTDRPNYINNNIIQQLYNSNRDDYTNFEVNQNFSLSDD